MNEDDIRDYLSVHLDLLAPNLELIGKPEHYLQNPHGSNGFIDLLTRNLQYQTFVPIELKKTKQTARQAIQEIFKYVALLQIQYKLSQDVISPIIAAIDWDDLLTPFSDFQRTVPYHVLGLKLIIDQNGVPISSVEVTPLPERQQLAFCPKHLIYLYRNERDREAAMACLITFLSECKIKDYVILRLNYPLKGIEGMYKYALYVATSTFSPAERNEIENELRLNLDPEEETESEDPWWFEEEVQCILNEKMMTLPYDDTVEISYPLKLSQTLSKWKVIDITRGGGALSNNEIYRDNDILFSLTLQDENPWYFADISNPRLKNHWQSFRQSLSAFLKKNQHLHSIVETYLDEMTKAQDLAVQFGILFRNTILMDLFVMHHEGMQNTPFNFDAVVQRSNSSEVRTLFGTICWNGTTHPKDASKLIAEQFVDTFDMLMSLQFGDSEHEDALMMQLGLSYELFEVIHNPEKDPELFHLELEGSKLIRTPADSMEYQPISSFVNANQPFLDELVQEISQYLYSPNIDSGAAENSLMSEPVVASIDLTATLKEKYPDYLRTDVTSVRIVQSLQRVWLEMSSSTEATVTRSDLGIVILNSDDGEEIQFFNAKDDISINAQRFVSEFDPYSIIITTDLFHDIACTKIACEYESQQNT